MLHVTPPGQSPDPPGLLASATIAATLARFRLPLYSGLAGWLEAPEVFCTLADIRQAFAARFDPGAPEILLYDLYEYEMWVLEQIEKHLFPLDGDFCYELQMNTEEFVVMGYVPFLGFAYPWEVLGLDGLPEGVAPLLAVLYAHLPPLAGMVERIDAGEWLIIRDDEVQDWLDRQHLVWPGAAWLAQPDMVISLLETLPEPLNGLADVYRLLRRDNGNVFLDTIPAEYYIEYGEFFDDHLIYGFTPHDLRRLEAEWDEASHHARQAAAYRHWYQNTPNAEARVVAALVEALNLETTGEDGDG